MEDPTQSQAHPKDSKPSKSLKRKVTKLPKTMPDSRLQMANMKVMCEVNEITHHQLEEHLMVHFDQINSTLSALPHKRVEALTELKRSFQARTVKTDTYTKGLACNLLKAIIHACSIQPDNLDSQLWRLSFFLSSWQVLCRTRPEHKLIAWESLERERLSAPDVLMCQCLYDQISSIHHKLSKMMEACHSQEDYNIILTIDE